MGEHSDGLAHDWVNSPFSPASCHRKRESWTGWIRTFHLKGWNKRRTGSRTGKGRRPSRRLARHNKCRYADSYVATTFGFTAEINSTPWAGFLSMGDSPHAARLLKCLQWAVAYGRRIPAYGTVTRSATRARGLTTATSFGTPVTPGGGRFFSGVPHPHLP